MTEDIEDPELRKMAKQRAQGKDAIEYKAQMDRELERGRLELEEKEKKIDELEIKTESLEAKIESQNQTILQQQVKLLGSKD